MSNLKDVLASISNTNNFSGIADMLRGVEKESLRVKPCGFIADSPHPKSLGSALMHPQITTDAKESLLEFITEPSTNINATLTRLKELHTFTYQQLGDELLWVTSMPGYLEKDIQASYYGSSNTGKIKSIYCTGLAHRYGLTTAIAGIHYNVSISNELWSFLKDRAGNKLSLQNFKTQGYFHLIRNFLRYYWLLLYSLGASPSVCKSLLKGRRHNLHCYNGDKNTLYAPYATSLRMSDLGFKSQAQENLLVNYNSLAAYTNTLCSAINQPHKGYAAKGIKNTAGDYQQLSDKLLQSESELYSVIRPKRAVAKGQSGLSAIATQGVEYIEVRCIDINPYEPVGINQQQIDFIDTFLLYCLLTDSPELTNTEYQNIQQNQQRVAYRGRDPELQLIDQGQERNMRQWATQLLEEFDLLAHTLDNATQGQKKQVRYRHSIATERQKLAADRLTPSAMMLSDMQAQNQNFTDFALSLAQQRKRYFCQQPFSKQQEYLSMAQRSLEQQQHAEAQQEIGFEEYLQQYYSQYQALQTAVGSR